MVSHFGRRLRRLRGDLSQREVATALGIPTTTLASLEQQEGQPRGAVLEKLAGYFGVPASYFYPDKPRTAMAATARIELLRTATFATKESVATNAAPDFPDEAKLVMLCKRVSKVEDWKQLLADD